MRILQEEGLVGMYLNDLAIFSEIRVLLTIYSLLFIVFFLENAIIPAVFLPGDSLLVVLGILIAKGVLNFVLTLGILTIAVSLGSWISYLQGRFLKSNRLIQSWFSRIPQRSYCRACRILNRYGLTALFITRFIAFARTVFPMVVGVSGLGYIRFQLCNWVSSFLWVFILIIVGFGIERLGII